MAAAAELVVCYERDATFAGVSTDLAVSRFVQQLEPSWHAAWGDQVEESAIRAVPLSSKEADGSELAIYLHPHASVVVLLSWDDIGKGGFPDSHVALLSHMVRLLGALPTVAIAGHAASRGSLNVCSQDITDLVLQRTAGDRFFGSQLMSFHQRLNKSQLNLLFSTFAQLACQHVDPPSPVESITVLSEDNASLKNFCSHLSKCLVESGLDKKPLKQLCIMSRDDEFALNARALYIVLVQGDGSVILSNSPDGDYRMILHRIFFCTGRMPIVAVSGPETGGQKLQEIRRVQSISMYMQLASRFSDEPSATDTAWLIAALRSEVARTAAPKAGPVERESAIASARDHSEHESCSFQNSSKSMQPLNQASVQKQISDLRLHIRGLQVGEGENREENTKRAPSKTANSASTSLHDREKVVMSSISACKTSSQSSNYSSRFNFSSLALDLQDELPVRSYTELLLSRQSTAPQPDPCEPQQVSNETPSVHPASLSLGGVDSDVPIAKDPDSVRASSKIPAYTDAWGHLEKLKNDHEQAVKKERERAMEARQTRDHSQTTSKQLESRAVKHQHDDNADIHDMDGDYTFHAERDAQVQTQYQQQRDALLQKEISERSVIDTLHRTPQSMAAARSALEKQTYRTSTSNTYGEVVYEVPCSPSPVETDEATQDLQVLSTAGSSSKLTSSQTKIGDEIVTASTLNSVASSVSRRRIEVALQAPQQSVTSGVRQDMTSYSSQGSAMPIEIPSPEKIAAIQADTRIRKGPENNQGSSAPSSITQRQAAAPSTPTAPRVLIPVEKESPRPIHAGTTPRDKDPANLTKVLSRRPSAVNGDAVTQPSTTREQTPRVLSLRATASTDGTSLGSPRNSDRKSDDAVSRSESAEYLSQSFLPSEESVRPVATGIAARNARSSRNSSLTSSLTGHSSYGSDAGAQVDIGLTLGLNVASHLFEVTSIDPSGVAAKSMLRIGDQICTIDGRDLQGMDETAVNSLLFGVPHSAVILGVRHLHAGNMSNDVVIIRSPTSNAACRMAPNEDDVHGPGIDGTSRQHHSSSSPPGSLWASLREQAEAYLDGINDGQGEYSSDEVKTSSTGYGTMMAVSNFGNPQMLAQNDQSVHYSQGGVFAGGGNMPHAPPNLAQWQAIAQHRYAHGSSGWQNGAPLQLPHAVQHPLSQHGPAPPPHLNQTARFGSNPSGGHAVPSSLSGHDSQVSHPQLAHPPLLAPQHMNQRPGSATPLSGSTTPLSTPLVASQPNPQTSSHAASGLVGGDDGRNAEYKAWLQHMEQTMTKQQLARPSHQQHSSHKQQVQHNHEYHALLSEQYSQVRGASSPTGLKNAPQLLQPSPRKFKLIDDKLVEVKNEVRTGNAVTPSSGKKNSDVSQDADVDPDIMDIPLANSKDTSPAKDEAMQDSRGTTAAQLYNELSAPVSSSKGSVAAKDKTSDTDAVFDFGFEVMQICDLQRDKMSVKHAGQRAVVCVSSVTWEGSARFSGQVIKGDAVLRINKTDLQDMSVAEVCLPNAAFLHLMH